MDVVDTHLFPEAEAPQGDVEPVVRVVGAGGHQSVARHHSHRVTECPDLLEMCGVVRVSIEDLPASPSPPHHRGLDLPASPVSVELRPEHPDAATLESHGRALGGAVALQDEGLLARGDGHPVVVDQPQLHDAGLVFPQLVRQMYF